MRETERIELLDFCLNYKQKLSQEFIMSYLEFKSKTAFSNFVNRNGYSLKIFADAFGLDAKVRELHDKGYGVYKIAKMLQKPPQTIYYIAHKYNLKTRPYNKEIKK
jgi:hypothetical protein